MLVKWISLKEAKRFIAAHHRHRPKLQGAIVALGCWDAGKLIGVATLGTPCRMESNDTVVITRLCTDGTPNACSKLYSKAKRLAQALGFTKIKTFTLPDESGSSLFAVGAEQQGQTRAQTWDRKNRPRLTGPLQKKVRWSL